MERDKQIQKAVALKAAAQICHDPAEVLEVANKMLGWLVQE